MRSSAYLFLSLSLALTAIPTHADDATTTGSATMSGVSSGWADFGTATDPAAPVHWIHMPGALGVARRPVCLRNAAPAWSASVGG